MAFRRSMSLALAALVGLGFMPAVSRAAGGKVATVDMARVLREYDEVKKAAQKLQQLKDGYQEQIDKKQQDIKALNDEIANAKDPEKKAKFEGQKKKKLIALQNEFQQLKEKLGEKEKEQFDAIKETIYKQIERLAQSKGVQMIFEKQWMYYPRQTEDLTDELLSTLSSTAVTKNEKAAPKTDEE
jgi:Skp family chaperone for outer membrane proteins